jgi:hypothetical protein
MAQADSIITATREGVSRGVSIKSTILRSAHTEAPLARNPIQLIYLDFKSKDTESRGDRLDKALAALHPYVAPFASATAQQIPGCILNRRDVRIRRDAVTVIRNTAEELRVHENWKLS